MPAYLTFLLVMAALAHVWLQVFNRYLITIPDGPRKPVWFQAWFAASVVVPGGLLLVLHDAPAVRDALTWRIESAGSRALFAAFGALWLFGLWRGMAWAADRFFPRRSRWLISEQITIPAIPRPPSRLVRFLRPIETTFDLEVVERELIVPGLPAEFDGFVIAHVADVHYDPRFGRRAYYEHAARLVNAMDADVVAFSGDTITSERWIERSARYHGRMKGRLATLIVMGNHDHWTDADAVKRECRRNGIRPMHNRRWELERAGRRLVFAGTDVPWGGRRSDWRRLLAHGPQDALILLSHSPDNAPVAARHGANLILSGHNHGGQYCFPVIGPIVVPSRTGHRFNHGVFDVGEDCVLCVSRGVGTSSLQGGGRTLSPPELIRLTLRAPVLHATVGAVQPVRRAVARRVSAVPG
ncbi:metallophosphoesterase [Candidatus Poribacteria bacterium]|nr:metallophosphoesterase [Candidatus Poribacteria bacterium]